MNPRVRILLLIAIVLSSTHSLFAQKKLSIKDKKEIQSSCEVYLRQQNVVFGNFNSSLDSIKSVVSRPMFDIILTQREHMRAMGYENVHFPESRFNSLILDDSIACLVVDEDGEELKINVKKIEDKWLVSGFDNHEANQKDIDNLKESIAEVTDVEVVKDSIKLILNDFIDGWSQYTEGEDSSLLISNATDECYNFIRVKKQYDQLNGNPTRRYRITKTEQVWISQDTARCGISLAGLGHTYAVLLLKNNIWRVAGLDDRVFNEEDVKQVEEDIKTYKELNLFNDRISDLNEHIEAFFKTGNRSEIKEYSTDRFIDQMEIYRRFIGTMDTSYFGMRGIQGSSWPEYEFVIYGNEAYYKTYGDSVRLVIEEGDWKFDEIFSGVNVGTQFEKVSQTFDDFADMFFVTYSIYNTYDDAPLDSDMPIRVIISSSDSPKDTVYANRADRYYPDRKYERGHEGLYRDIKYVTAKYKNSYKGVIYVEFDLDQDGQVSNIHALDRIGSEEAGCAEKVVARITDWLPSEKDGPSITNYVVAVEF